MITLKDLRKWHKNISLLNSRTKCQENIKQINDWCSANDECFMFDYTQHSDDETDDELHFLQPDHSTFIHLFIVIAILMVSIRWLLTFPLTAFILLPHAAAAFCLGITYFNHSCPTYLIFCFQLLIVFLDCCSFLAFLTYLDLCYLPDLVLPFCQPFFKLLTINTKLNIMTVA